MRKIAVTLAALVLGVLACNVPGTGSDGGPPIEVTAVTPDATSGGQTPEVGAPTSTTSANTPPASEPTSEAAGVLPAPLYFIAEDQQIWRVEPDGATVSQITSEAAPVVSFDVSPADGSVAFVSNNVLILTDASGGNRTELFNGGPLPADDDWEGQVNRTMGAVAWSPDGSTIAFGFGGVNLYNVSAASNSVAIPSDPYPELDSGNYPEGPVQFYSPDSWSPSGNRLLVNFSYFPEAGGMAVYEIASASVTQVTSPEGIACCDAAWSLDDASLFWANPTPGMVPSGMWRADAPGWVAATLIHGESEGGWMMPQAPQPLEDGLLYYFFGTQDTFPEGNVPLRLTRSALDGLTNRETLRDDAYSIAEVLWAQDASGAVIVDLSSADPSQYPFVGNLLWLSTDGNPALTLPQPGRHLRWGK